MRFKSIVILLMMCFSEAYAQKGLTFRVQGSLPAEINFLRVVADRDLAYKQAGRIITQLMNKGYLSASIDTLIYRNDSAIAMLYLGKLFKWGQVSYKFLPAAMVKQFGFDQTKNGVVALENLKNAMNQTIGHFENKGYPFAYFYWDSLVIRDDSVHGSIFFEKNIFISFDTLALYGQSGLSKNFLYNYLGFKPGEPYSEMIVSQMPKLISKLPFVSMVSKPQLFFVGRKAIALIHIKKRKTDRLDGLIGFAPNTGTPGNSKLLVTGEFHLDLKNLKGSGKGFKVDWQSFQARSQALNVATTLPYLFNQPMGVELNADFLKYDTLYTETKFHIGTQYIFSGLDNVKIFYEQKNTNLQSVDTQSIRLNKRLADKTAMKTNRYGVALNWVTFNNRISPVSGFSAEATASIYSRQIKKDIRIEKVKFYDKVNASFYTVYDSMQILSYQVLIQYDLAKPVLLGKRVVLFNQLSGFHFISPSVYFNELFRFGGNKSLRGFNEQSLFASSASIFNLEVRYLLSENSFLKLFGNTAYYIDQSSRPGKIDSDFPYGFGGGINLDTGSGIVNMSVALGKSKYNPIDLKNAKIHFGLINYF